ncbi:MAG: hypothetical protein R6U46_11085 [Marinilabilia sp.]
MKRTMLWILPLAGLLAFSSCNDDESPFEPEADAFILSEVNEDGAPVFAPVFYVYGNKDIDVVTVQTPMGDEIELGPDGNLSSRFKWEPSEEDFEQTPPQGGTYSFDILAANGEEVELTDELGSGALSPVDIYAAEVESNILEMEWSEAQGALAYTLRIHSITEDGERQIYGSNFIETDSLRLNPAQENFETQPNVGEDYILEIQAYMFEDGTQSEFEYNIQAISSAKDTVTWN